MRISYSDEEGFAGQFNLWQANCARSVAGRRGQNALRELEAALLALPAPRLIMKKLDDGVDCCAIGALVRQKRITPQADPDYEMELVGEECGLPRMVAWKVVELNDIELTSRWEPWSAEYGGGQWVDYTPEERYEAVLRWVRGQLA
jgi:hypothetical protein